MFSKIFVLALFFIVTFASEISDVYFILDEGQTRCFLEEVPKDTLVVGKYYTEEAERTAAAAKPGIKVTVLDAAAGTTVLQREMAPAGRFAFTAQTAGEHKICVQTNTSRWFGTKMRVVSLFFCLSVCLFVFMRIYFFDDSEILFGHRNW
jgi:p24 family protein alpha